MHRRMLAFACIGCAGCWSESSDPITQIVVAVESDLEPPREIDEVRFRVAGGSLGAGQVATVPVAKREDFPLTLAIVHEKGPLDGYAIEVTGWLGGRLVIQVSQFLAFEAGEIMRVSLRLPRAISDAGRDTTVRDASGDSDGRAM